MHSATLMLEDLSSCGACGVLAFFLSLRGRQDFAPLPNKCQQKAPSVSQLRLRGVVLGGCFGRVCLAEASDGKEWAVIAFAKKEANETKQEDYLASLQDLGSRWNHPHVLRIEEQWARNDSFLFAVTEYCSGGSLYSLAFQRHGRLSEREVIAGVKQIASALRYLHSFAVVYRNIKAEGVLVDAAGRLKLNCSRFSKRLPASGRLWTLCGVTEYLAPEMLQCRGHGLAVDVWALGVLVFELLIGKPPFSQCKDGRRYGLHEKILRCHIEWPDKNSIVISQGALLFIQTLLSLVPGRRPAAADLLQKPAAKWPINCLNLRDRLHINLPWEATLWLCKDDGYESISFSKNVKKHSKLSQGKDEADPQRLFLRKQDGVVPSAEFTALSPSGVLPQTETRAPTVDEESRRCDSYEHDQLGNRSSVVPPLASDSDHLDPGKTLCLAAQRIPAMESPTDARDPVAMESILTNQSFTMASAHSSPEPRQKKECDDVDFSGFVGAVASSPIPRIGLGTKPHALNLLAPKLGRGRTAPVMSKPSVVNIGISADSLASQSAKQEKHARRNPFANSFESNRPPNGVGSDIALPAFPDVFESPYTDPLQLTGASSSHATAPEDPDASVWGFALWRSCNPSAPPDLESLNFPWVASPCDPVSAVETLSPQRENDGT